MMSCSFLLIWIVAIHCIQTEDTNTSKMDVQLEWTAGNTMCRADHKCGFHDNKPYSWCYTNDTHWGYCCTGPCTTGSETTNYTSYRWCESGTSWQYCGGAGTTDVQERDCLDTHRCGVHFEEGEREGKWLANWCYVDSVGTYGFCCAPGWSCDFHGDSYLHCYISSDSDSNEWEVCVIDYFLDY